jgi:hypothetical protein
VEIDKARVPIEKGQCSFHDAVGGFRRLGGGAEDKSQVRQFRGSSLRRISFDIPPSLTPFAGKFHAPERLKIKALIYL